MTPSGDSLNRRKDDTGTWLRWLLGGLLGSATTISLAAGAGILRHESRLTAVESDTKTLKDADALLRAEMNHKDEQNRADLAEIKADIKLLLARGK